MNRIMTTSLFASAAALILAHAVGAATITNASIDAASGVALVSFSSLNDDFGETEGTVFQVIGGSPTGLTISSWATDLVVAELADTDPGDYFVAIGVPGDPLAFYTVTVPSWKPSGDDVVFEDGNVGIGTSTPVERLEVWDAANPRPTFGNLGDNSGQRLVTLRLNHSNGNGVQMVGARSPGNDFGMDLRVRTEPIAGGGTLERMRITSEGLVGIGTTAPTEVLDVDGNVLATSFLGDGSGLSHVDADLIDGLEGAELQQRVSETCGPGFAMREILEDGTVICTDTDIFVVNVNYAGVPCPANSVCKWSGTCGDTLISGGVEWPGLSDGDLADTAILESFRSGSNTWELAVLNSNTTTEEFAPRLVCGN